MGEVVVVVMVGVIRFDTFSFRTENIYSELDTYNKTKLNTRVAQKTKKNTHTPHICNRERKSKMIKKKLRIRYTVWCVKLYNKFYWDVKT